MRADASNEPARDFKRQSQRTTRRFESEDFHPLPPQTGQTSAATFMNCLCCMVSTLNVQRGNEFAQVLKSGMAVHILWSYGKFVENREYYAINFLRSPRKFIFYF